MKILQVSNRVPWPLDEGGNIGIYNFSRAFSELGNQVTLYCLDGLKHNTPLKEAHEELSKYAKTYIHPIDTDIKAFDALTALIKNESYNISRFYNSAFESKLIDLLRKEKFDVIQLEGSFVGPYLKAIRANFKGPTSIRMHNVEYEIWERLSFNEDNFIKKAYLAKLAKQLKHFEQQLLKQVDLIVSITKDDDAKFEEFNTITPRIIIPAGIDLDVWQSSPSTSHLNWYHIGSMEWHANLEAVNWFLKDIHPLLIEESEKYSFHLAGKGLGHAEIKNYPRLHLYNTVANAYAFVKELDVCVVPLKSGSGIRLKILEAMAAGKLVISTTIGAQGIEYVANKHLLIADTPVEFLNHFKALSKGKVDINKMVKNARNLIEAKYSTNALAKDLVDNYSKL